MHAAPSVEIVVARFGVWRVATLLLAALVIGAMSLWWSAHLAPRPAWLSAAAALGVIVAVIGAATTMAPLVLRASGGQWQLARNAEPAVSGEVMVALDLGAWMLLRFTPGAGVGRARWIAVQRRGLEPQWHALRCAVYAPRQKHAVEGATVDV